MPKPKNKITTQQITISTNTILCEDLDRVVKTGYYGNTRPEAAERLITEAIRHLIREGTILKKNKIVKM
jgi:metal-responsive CopG/Arc/MetJ family transcriptional regulator